MKTVEASGYSKQKAYESTGLDVDFEMLKNATALWKKSGSPMNTKQMNLFMQGYIKDKKAVGAYIVVEPAVDDTRTRPYSVINETTIGKRKSTTTYQIKPAELSVKYRKAVKTVVDKVTGEEKEVEYSTPYETRTIEVEVDVLDEDGNKTGEKTTRTKDVEVPQVKVLSTGAVEGRASKKNEALRILKDLIEANKKDYVIEIAKEVTEGQKYAAYGEYTPSKSAKIGKFVFFVAE